MSASAGGDMVARMLKARQMSQSQLAERMGVDHSTINRIVMGSRHPSRETVKAICQELELVNGMGERVMIAFGYTPFDGPLDEETAGRVYNLAVRINNAGLTTTQREVMRVAVDALELFADEFGIR